MALDKTTKIVVGAAAAVGVAGLAYVVVTHATGPGPSSVAALQLSAASLSISTGQDDEVTVVATDSAGNLVAGVSGITLVSNGTTVEAFPATDTNGTATLQVSFAAAGTYVLEAVL